MAAPIFVIGTSGVFVSATVYHSFQLAKKLATEPKNLIQQ